MDETGKEWLCVITEETQNEAKQGGGEEGVLTISYQSTFFMPQLYFNTNHYSHKNLY